MAAVLVTSAGLACACQTAAAGPIPGVRGVPLPARVTGANVRPVGDPRRGYGSETARTTMARLQAMGVNTIGVLLEGHMRAIDAPDIALASAEDRAAVVAALTDARARGLATVLIPHLYSADGRWRGEIRWTRAEDGDRWWSNYRRFVLDAAELAARGGASVLSVGVELKALSGTEDARARFAALITEVRGRFGGQLTYSANWDEAEGVRLWDLVDLAGVNGYYPLLPDPDRGAQDVARRLSRLAALAGRPVLVLEVGYRAGPLPHVRPWEWPEHVDPAAVDPAAQARAWAAVLAHWLDAPGVRGLLLWVVPTDPDDPASEPAHGFNPLNRPAEEVIRRAFSGAGRS